MYKLKTKTKGSFSYSTLKEAREDSLLALKDGEFFSLSNSKGVLLCL